MFCKNHCTGSTQGLPKLKGAVWAWVELGKSMPMLWVEYANTMDAQELKG